MQRCQIMLLQREPNGVVNKIAQYFDTMRLEPSLEVKDILFYSIIVLKQACQGNEYSWVDSDSLFLFIQDWREKLCCTNAPNITLTKRIFEHYIISTIQKHPFYFDLKPDIDGNATLLLRIHPFDQGSKLEILGSVCKTVATTDQKKKKSVNNLS